MNVGVDVIEPTGFIFSDARMKRAGMDYIDQVQMTRHVDWAAFHAQLSGRLMLLSTKASADLYASTFQPSDVLLFGCESAGVPDYVVETCALRMRIPIASSARSLNLSVAAGIALGEALRQTGGLPS